MHHNMTFFDKLFTIKNRNNKNENGLKIGIEPLSFSSSHLELPKEQIRVVLFRECDRRGRKLLFDSHSVEKLSLGSSCQSAAGYLCRQKCDQGVKISDFVEVTSTHGYRYKKPCNNVTALGEMIFGSVAMVYRGGNTCKIHSIPSPKRVMFTTVVHAPGHCRYRTASERSNDGSLAGSSLTSLNEDLEINQTSSSDSKLYKNKESNKINTSTYPCLKNTSALNPVTNSLEIGIDLNKSLLQKISNINCRSVCSSSSSESIKNNLNYETKLTGCERLAVNSSHDKFDAGSNGHLNSSRKNSDCKYFDPGDSFGCSNVIFQQLTDSKNGSSSNVSSWSGSLGSLRRRWMQSHATSVDNPCCDETESAPSRTRTKLGLGLVIDLTDTLQDEIEKFLFNHTIVIDSILNKLQSSIEMAYLRKEHFVDLTHTAFLDCQQSMHELITGGKYAKPVWVTMTEETKIEPEPKPQVLENIYSHLHDSIKPNSKKQDSVNNLKLKFLNDFCEVLTRFDTKNTNFFISTLLTAVLTHHLSWVTSIADSDNLASSHKLRYAIKNLRPYNPIWAQLNDLCGLLGSPLKSTKTIVTGSETNRHSMASILQIVTYFVRCYNVVESVYDSDINEITKFDENCLMSQEKLYEDFENFDSGIDCTYNGVSENKCVNRFHVQKIENNEQSITADKKVIEPEKPVEITSTIENSDNSRRIQENNFQKSAYSGGLKRSKSCLSRLKSEGSLKKCNKLYPSIDDLAKMENISLSDLDFNEKNNKRNISMSNGDLSEKIQKLIRVPSKAVICHLEQNLSPDEGYDTVDSSNVREIFSQKLENQEFDSSFSSPKKSDNVLFVLGENEELVNLSKKVVMTKSSVIDIEKEDSENNILLDSRNNNVGRSKSMNILVTCCERMSEKRCRTLENVFSDCEKNEDRTLWQNIRDDEEISQHSQLKCEEAGRKTPWIRCELPMPRVAKSTCCSQRLDVSSVIGSVNDHYNSEQIVQGVLEEKKYWEHTLRKDLSLGAHNPVLESEVTETLCIIADMDAWEVSVCSSHTYVVDRNKYAGVRVGMSQIVADMLESLLQLQRMKLSPEFCLYHIEKKLREIYMKSKSVAELLDTTELCTMDYLTSRLDIGVNDVPLLLAVATTHSPHITSKYGLSFT